MLMFILFIETFKFLITIIYQFSRYFIFIYNSYYCTI